MNKLNLTQWTLFSSRWPLSNKFNRGKGGKDSRRKTQMYLPDKYCRFQLRRLKLHDPLEVKCSSVFLCSAAMFHFSSCLTQVSHSFYCCCAAFVSSLDCCKPVLPKHCVITSCKKNPDIWSYIVSQWRGVDHRKKLVQLLHLVLSTWKTEGWEITIKKPEWMNFCIKLVKAKTLTYCIC